MGRCAQARSQFLHKNTNKAAGALAASALTTILMMPPAQADDGVTGMPSTAPGSPVAVLELQGGVAVKTRPAASAGLDVETRPFISQFVGLRIGMSWVAQSAWSGQNLSQLGSRLQVTAGWSRLEIAVGPIYLQHTDAYNSSRLNIDSTIDFAITDHLRVRAEHWSNAQSTLPNEGRDLFLLNYRF
jgi:hypothetical protein